MGATEASAHVDVCTSDSPDLDQHTAPPPAAPARRPSGVVHAASREEEMTEEEQNRIDDEDLKEVARELFDELRGKDKKLSVTAFVKSDNVKEMLEDGVMTKAELNDIVEEAADGKKVLDFEQFFVIVSELDVLARGKTERDAPC